MNLLNEVIEVFEKDRGDPKSREWIKRELGKEKNFFVFCKFLMPDSFFKEFAEFHKELISDFMKEQNSVVACPRGHAKSTLIGLGWVLWNILYNKKGYIVYMSQNHKKSVQFLEPLTNELKNNPVIKVLWPGLRFVKGKDEFTGRDREDCFDIGTIRLEALSFEKNIRGMKYKSQRPDLIVLDDVEDDMRVINPELRRKDSDKLNKQIIPSLDAEFGVYKMVGTILHNDSLLKKKLRLLDGKVYRACEFNKDGGIIADTILFPTLFNEGTLLALRKEMGSAAFESEYLNNPVDDSSSLIKREWVIQCFDHNLSFCDNVKFDFLVQGVDFAFSDRVSADKSAFVGVGRNEDGYTIISCFTKKGMSITEQFDYIEYLTGVHGFDDNALEENSIRSMSKELKDYSFPFTLFWTAARDPATKRAYEVEFDEKRHTVGKTDMINRLATQFENKNLVIPYRTEQDKVLAHQIMDECCSFGLSDGKLVEFGVHPDIPIGLGLAIERIEMNSFVAEIGMLEL